MPLKNSKLSSYKIKRLIKCFCLDLTSQQCSEFLGLNRNTVNRYYLIFRKAIYKHQKAKQVGFLENKDLNCLLELQPQISLHKIVLNKWVLVIYERENTIFTHVTKKESLIKNIKTKPSIINNLHRFWGFSKQRLNKFNGVQSYFKLHIKECEWRWKKSLKNMEKELKKLLLISISFLILSKNFFESNFNTNLID